MEDQNLHNNIHMVRNTTWLNSQPNITKKKSSINTIEMYQTQVTAYRSNAARSYDWKLRNTELDGKQWMNGSAF